MIVGGNHQRVAKKCHHVEEFDAVEHRRAVADDAHLVIHLPAFAFGQGLQLQPGGVHFADMRQVELKHLAEIPRKVTINEAVELAKNFGNEASSAFINGLLDKIATTVGKA